MPKVSVSKVKPLPTKTDYFYGNEILPDFRARKEATLKDLEAVPPDDPTEIGMPTINPKSEVQKYFVEFCSASTMLGFNHIVAPHRHPVENSSFPMKGIVQGDIDRNVPLDLDRGVTVLLEAVPPDDPTEIGMPTINPKSEVQKYFVEFCSASTMLGFNHIVAPHKHPCREIAKEHFCDRVELRKGHNAKTDHAGEGVTKNSVSLSSFPVKGIVQGDIDRNVPLDLDRGVTVLLEAVPPDDPTEIGMPTINPESEVQKYFVEFCSASTMLGFNHIVAPHKHPVEKYLAMTFVGIALILLAFLSIIFWNRYQYEATVIVLDNDHEHFRVMKPAVFICPVPNIEKSKFAEVFMNNSIEHTPEAEKFFTFLANVNYENMHETPDFDLVPPEKWLKILHEIRRNIPPLTLKESDPYEAVIITERGLCSANRNLVGVYSTYEYWMSNNWTIVPKTGDIPDFDYNDHRSQETFVTKNDALFAIADSGETMSFNVPVRWMKPKFLQRPIMSMFRIKTKSNVKELRVHQRGCKFYTDGGLKTWPIYTRHMCIIECRMRKIQHHCKCRPHFARPIDGVEICNTKQLRCIADITDKLFLLTTTPEYCNCIPICNSVNYIITETKTSELEVPTTQSSITIIVDFPTIVLERSLLYGFSDFLSSVGGAAGLLLGASVLSFVEIFYFATVHAFFHAQRAKQRKKKSLFRV